MILDGHLEKTAKSNEDSSSTIFQEHQGGLTMSKVKIVITGKVQGVGFRYNTLMIAKNLGVYGRVWNNPDGTVSIQAQSDDQTLFNFQKRIREGNHWIRVNYLDVESDNFEDFHDFKIIN